MPTQSSGISAARSALLDSTVGSGCTVTVPSFPSFHWEASCVTAWLQLQFVSFQVLRFGVIACISMKALRHCLKVSLFVKYFVWIPGTSIYY